MVFMAEQEQTGQHYILESFEEAWAVLEAAAGETFRVPRSWLPSAAKEGDVLGVSLESGDESNLRFAVDPAETDARRQRADELRADLPEGPEEDLEL